MEVRNRVGQIDRALGAVRVEPVLERGREPACDNGRSGKAIRPGDRRSLVVEPGGDPVEPVRTVHVVLDVFLARPHDLHGTIDVLADLRRPNGDVLLEASPEPATDEMVVNHDLLGWQAESL